MVSVQIWWPCFAGRSNMSSHLARWLQDNQGPDLPRRSCSTGPQGSDQTPLSSGSYPLEMGNVRPQGAPAGASAPLCSAVDADCRDPLRYSKRRPCQHLRRKLSECVADDHGARFCAHEHGIFGYQGSRDQRGRQRVLRVQLALTHHLGGGAYVSSVGDDIALVSSERVLPVADTVRCAGARLAAHLHLSPTLCQHRTLHHHNFTDPEDGYGSLRHSPLLCHSTFCRLLRRSLPTWNRLARVSGAVHTLLTLLSQCVFADGVDAVVASRRGQRRHGGVASRHLHLRRSHHPPESPNCNVEQYVHESTGEEFRGMGDGLCKIRVVA
mmetsp:Transcript_72753/g.171143  ORF Transcript_72753/g.171143 Transcript_72753/m.171143 type:complete len:325 (+) Transcript_72753:247-1221(+)